MAEWKFVDVVSSNNVAHVEVGVATAFLQVCDIANDAAGIVPSTKDVIGWSGDVIDRMRVSVVKVELQTVRHTMTQGCEQTVVRRVCLVGDVDVRGELWVKSNAWKQSADGVQCLYYVSQVTSGYKRTSKTAKEIRTACNRR